MGLTGAYVAGISISSSGATTLNDGTDTALVDDIGNLMVNLGVRLDNTNDSIASVGKIAHDTADNGTTNPPVKAGAHARTSFRTAVANDDVVDLLADIYGRMVTAPYANPENWVSGVIANASAITDTTATTVIATPGASLKLYITHLVIQNSHATVSTWVDVTEQTSGTVLYTLYCPALGGGGSITFPVPLVVPTADRALQVKPVTTGANIRAAACGFKAP